jgi:hypothetical protein
MRQLYENLKKIDKIDFLECWKLYMDLVETENNPETIEFYEWELISYHKDYYLLDIYKKNMNDNISIIIDKVEDIIRDITNNTVGYIIYGDNVSVDYGLIKCINCGNIWDGNAQCNCSWYN